MVYFTEFCENRFGSFGVLIMRADDRNSRNKPLFLYILYT